MNQLSLLALTVAWSMPMQTEAKNTKQTEPVTKLLWPEGAPGAKGTEDVDKPSVTIYLPAKEKRNGMAVVVCPGGGYGGLANDHEGKQIAAWLVERGAAAFVLKYRLGTRYHHPAPLQDAQRAVRLVRSCAGKEFGIDPTKVGIWGFSAGGHLASTVATHFDDGNKESKDPIEKESSRPDFAILCYPVITLVPPFAHMGSRNNLLGKDADPKLVESLCNDKQVTAKTPPTFLFHTIEDKAVPVENSQLFRDACEKHGVPVELYILEKGSTRRRPWYRRPGPIQMAGEARSLAQESQAVTELEPTRKRGHATLPERKECGRLRIRSERSALKRTFSAAGLRVTLCASPRQDDSSSMSKLSDTAMPIATPERLLAFALSFVLFLAGHYCFLWPRGGGRWIMEP